jgi:hypothetical protein
MNFFIGSLRDFRERGISTHFTFNLAVVDETDRDFTIHTVITGMRIVNGKIYAPSVKYGGKYITVAYFSKEWAKEVYDKLLLEIPADYIMANFQDAIVALLVNRKNLDMFVPELA